MTPKRALRNWMVPATLAVVAVLLHPATASQPGLAAANQVSQSSYLDFMDDWLFTHVGDNRGPSGPDLIPARNNIQSLMQSYGLTVTLEPFTYGGTTYHNVVGTKLGTTYPSRIYIIGAHYDSVSNPGADDNASGVALVLESARILSGYRSDSTIRFIAFSMEEAGLIGSEAYVSAHYTDDIRGMVSADMVAYDPDTNHANIYGRTASNPIKTSLANAIAEYGAGLTFTVGGDTPYSDHAPFEADGYQACLLIEGEVWSNPYYHQQSDNFENPDNLNFPYAVKMTRSVVGWLVDQAGVAVPYNALEFSYPDGQPEFISPAGGTRMRVQIAEFGSAVHQTGTGLLHFDAGAGRHGRLAEASWQTVPMNIVSTDVYEAVFPAAACGDQVAYYVSAEAVGGETFTDPWGAAANSYSAMAAYGEIVALAQNLNANPGWTAAGQWAFGQPTGGGGEYGGPDPTSGHTGNYVYGYNLSGDYANSLPETHLTSTPIDCTGVFGARLTFWRWLGVEQPQYDHAYVRISNNGVNWTTLWENTAEVADSAWTQMDLDVSAVADNQPAVYLRWTMGQTDGGWRYCGWNIDDIQIVASRCAPLPGDYDFDGDADLDDYVSFPACMTGPQIGPPDGDCVPFDFNADDDVDVADFAAFQEVLGP